MKIIELLIRAYEILKKEGIESYIIDAQLLLCKVLKVSKIHLMVNKDEIVNEDKQDEFWQLVEQRRNRTPIKYILGSCEFMGIDFNIKPGVLIPRPDTEILVEESLNIIKKNNFKVVSDMCCGSGAIGLSIAKNIEDVKIYLYDVSDIALEVTRDNICGLKLEERATVEKSDLFSKAIKDDLKFNIIVSNPPYIKEELIHSLMEDVRDYEPHLALSGGEDGLFFYRKITEQSKKILLHNGYLAFEIGYDQELEVIEIMKEQGFINLYALKDLAGNSRVVVGNLP